MYNKGDSLPAYLQESGFTISQARQHSKVGVKKVAVTPTIDCDGEDFSTLPSGYSPSREIHAPGIRMKTSSPVFIRKNPRLTRKEPPVENIGGLKPPLRTPQMRNPIGIHHVRNNDKNSICSTLPAVEVQMKAPINNTRPELLFDADDMADKLSRGVPLLSTVWVKYDNEGHSKRNMEKDKENLLGINEQIRKLMGKGELFDHNEDANGRDTEQIEGKYCKVKEETRKLKNEGESYNIKDETCKRKLEVEEKDGDDSDFAAEVQKNLKRIRQKGPRTSSDRLQPRPPLF